MDVNALKTIDGFSSTVASPAVPITAPDPARTQTNQDTERIKRDIVEFTNDGQVDAAESPLVANSNENIRSGSHVFHDETTNQFVVQIVNESNEVIRQLPTEEALRIAGRFRQVTGLIFDQST